MPRKFSLDLFDNLFVQEETQMSLARVCTALFAFLIAIVPTLASQPAAIDVWFVDSLTKVFPSDTPGKRRSAAPDFWAARNQHLSIQFAIRSAFLQAAEKVVAAAGK